MIFKGTHTRASGTHKRLFRSKINEIIKTCECSKSLMIAIYHINDDYFLGCSEGLKKITGTSENKLLNEGWDFWYSVIHPSEKAFMKERLMHFFSCPNAVEELTLRYHINDSNNQKKYIRHEILLHKIERYSLAINYFFDISDKEKIERIFDDTRFSKDSKNFQKLNHPISVREKEVLHLIGDGFSSKQIAEMLYISNHTAISHRKNLIDKFQVKNTAQLINKASKIMQI